MGSTWVGRKRQEYSLGERVGLGMNEFELKEDKQLVECSLWVQVFIKKDGIRLNC